MRRPQSDDVAFRGRHREHGGRRRRTQEGHRAEGTGCFQSRYPEREIPQNVRIFLNATGRSQYPFWGTGSRDSRQMCMQACPLGSLFAETHSVQTVLRPVAGISSHFGNFSVPDRATGNSLSPSARCPSCVRRRLPPCSLCLPRNEMTLAAESYDTIRPRKRAIHPRIVRSLFLCGRVNMDILGGPRRDEKIDIEQGGMRVERGKEAKI